MAQMTSSPECEYLLAPAPALADSGVASVDAVAGDAGLTILCIDISGSMGITQSMPQLQAAWRTACERQPMPEYVSRLQCMKLAALRHIEHLKSVNPQNKVLLITFSSEVHIIGDGIMPPASLGGSTLDSSEALQQAGQAAAVGARLACLGESHAGLAAKIEALFEGGSTALGPCLAFAVGYAARCARTEIILCTDGQVGPLV